MGLIYDARDSASVMSALSGNLARARSMVDDTERASEHLLAALSTGRLSGAGYAAIALVFSEAVLPTVRSMRRDLELVRHDLEKYRWEDSKVSRYGVLRQDELTAQLQATTSQRDATERLMELNQHAATALSVSPLLAEALRLMNRRLELVLGQLQNDVRDLEERLQALQQFDSATRGLFGNRQGTRAARSEQAASRSGSIRPASLTVPIAGAGVQQIAQWLLSGAYSIAELTAVCGAACVMAAMALVVLGGVGAGSTTGTRYTPAEQLRRSQLRWYYFTHNLDGSLRQRIGPAPTELDTYFNDAASFDDVEGILDEKTRPGRTHPHREVDTQAELDELAEEISQGGKAVEGPASYEGTWVELPDGTRIGRRTDSTSGGPTIDIQPPKGRPIKVHLPKGWGK